MAAIYLHKRNAHICLLAKKNLLAGKRLAKSASTSYLSAFADGLSTFPIWGLLQLHRADPSAAPDKIVNEFKLLLKITDQMSITKWLNVSRWNLPSYNQVSGGSGMPKML